MTSEKLNNKWCLWYHSNVDSWSKDSFQKLCTIDTVSDFWGMINTLKENPAIVVEHIYLMREGIYPIWEDKHNRNGGCWSIKVDIKDSFITFVNIIIHMIGENILYKDGNNISYEITGLSMCQKNNYNSVLQIWSSNTNNNKINYLHSTLTNKFGYEIIFRSHIPEN